MKQNAQSIYTTLSNKFNIPYQVVEVICNHPFLFTSRVISNPEDTRTVMFQYLGKIKIKNKYANKENSTKESK